MQSCQEDHGLSECSPMLHILGAVPGAVVCILLRISAFPLPLNSVGHCCACVCEGSPFSVSAQIGVTSPGQCLPEMQLLLYQH